MSALDNQTIEQLSDALTIELDDATVERHFAAIEAELLSPAQHMHNGVSRWRLRLVAVAAVVLAVIPGLALAADDALPGDFLYPVKRLAEPVMELLRDDVAANNRVEELDRLTQRPSTADEISDAIDDASDAVSDLPADHPLRHRLDRIADEVTPIADPPDPTDEVRPGNDREPGVGNDSVGQTDSSPVTTTQPAEDRSDDLTTTTTEAPDRSSTTSTRPTDGEGSQGVDGGGRDR